MDPRRAWRAATLLTLCLFVSGLPAGHASGSSDTSSLLTKLNQERTRRGLRALSHATDLAAVARRHSSRMAAAKRVYHNPNLGNDVQGWRSVGENVAAGPSASSVHNYMMRSSEHRGNILDQWNEVGVGVAYRGSSIYVTEVFALRSRIPAAPKVSRARRVHHRRAAPRPVPVVAPKPPPAPPVRSVTVLLTLLLMDNPVWEPPARSRSSLPVRDR